MLTRVVLVYLEYHMIDINVEEGQKSVLSQRPWSNRSHGDISWVSTWSDVPHLLINQLRGSFCRLSHHFCGSGTHGSRRRNSISEKGAVLHTQNCVYSTRILWDSSRSRAWGHMKSGRSPATGGVTDGRTLYLLEPDRFKKTPPFTDNNKLWGDSVLFWYGGPWIEKVSNWKALEEALVKLTQSKDYEIYI